MILSHQVLKIINLLRGMCTICIYVYIIHIVMNTGHTAVGIFELTYVLHFDQKIL